MRYLAFTFKLSRYAAQKYKLSNNFLVLNVTVLSQDLKIIKIMLNFGLPGIYYVKYL